MPDRDVTLYIVDVLIALNRINRYCSEFNNAEDFLHSEIEWDATIRELQVVGDATNVILKHGLIDESYRRIVDFRNQLVHAYFGIDENIVWEVVSSKLLKFSEELIAAVNEKNIDLKQAIYSAISENQHNKHIVSYLKNLL
ncbi:MAG: HepT-like ribonuclease domain-containing protein [Planctomycetota bacterium]|jgi:uncharacterized protein with HEPN domain